MLTHPTLDQLRALKLDGMAQAFAGDRRPKVTPRIASPENVTQVAPLVVTIRR
jgi:hypothetical protein